MMARTLLVETHAAGRFKANLEAVLATPADVLARARLANEVARRRAARYLDDLKRLFPQAGRAG